MLNSCFRCNRQSFQVYCSCFSTNCQRAVPLTQQEVSAALRPFYFAVHPDLFYQFPREKEINENSLKQLNFYLETVLKNLPTSPISLTFCLKDGQPKVNKSASFKHVNIHLLDKDVHRLLHKILSTCQLSTDYLDALKKSKPSIKVNKKPKEPPTSQPADDKFHSTWWREAQQAAEDIEQRIRNEPDMDMKFWLNKNAEKALIRLQASQPLRDETERLCKELKELLHLKEIVWNCGWGITHFRGCLQSFKTLYLQHPDIMSTLSGRTLVFGRQTGVSFEGHIILSSEDVRNHWIDMIQSVGQFDELLSQVPQAERSLSEVLRGILVDHRKFQPAVMVQKYSQQLGKLTSALYKHRWVHGYPSSWPRRLDKFQIVVECEAGPLMLSPTGQFIVPASCPALLLVDFISKNMEEANHRLQLYNTMKRKELKVYMQSMSELGLSSLEKDDNITPDLMVHCCERLLEEPTYFGCKLLDLRLRITNYYSILQDGEMCIPWDWMSKNL
ncbi:T-cell activation inhibitor, mitochondrial [Parasteatoda tepidariorum]|uniref:T-cell activation inhibitor, mitochondrial n=1 Tax=Parasteatoda tepidariorum TaxID=114398 RepID=UPI001C729CD7|nr:T-cell activation inhibitor, mitochondrial [Parasteatoda tepidariorum]